MARILLVLSASDHWTLKDGSRHPTGYWAEEFVVPHQTFLDRGVEVTLATPGGGRPSVDEASLSPEMNDGDTAKTAELRQYLDAVGRELSSPAALEEVVGHALDFDAVYIPGGHGPMEDLPECEPLGRIIAELHEARRTVAAMCHGPAGLLSARRRDGGWLFEGRRVTAFTDAEERGVGLADKAPWLLEDRLREQGARFEVGTPWQSHVIKDGNLVTGQNPASSRSAAEETLAALGVARR